MNSKMVTRLNTRVKAFIRLKEEDKALLMKIAQHYDISESDVIRIALKEFAANHGVDIIMR